MFFQFVFKKRFYSLRDSKQPVLFFLKCIISCEISDVLLVMFKKRFYSLRDSKQPVLFCKNVSFSCEISDVLSAVFKKRSNWYSMNITYTHLTVEFTVFFAHIEKRVAGYMRHDVDQVQSECVLDDL